MDAIRSDKLINNYMVDIKKIDVKQDLHLMTWPFCLSTELWEKYSSYNHMADLSKLKKIKYFDDNSQLSEQVLSIPKDKGGIYIYIIENSVIPITGSYIMYIGRARKTENESLYHRAKSHFNQYKRHEENERLERVFDNWKRYVYLLYLPIDGNEIIDQVENELILALAPPCNKDYPAPQIRRKLSAFNYS